jgi:D-glycero-alpha-D-manno-heptose-7-phosphate kinase
MKRGFFARAPSRIDFAGGTLDLPFFAEREHGATLNCAVQKYGYASIVENHKVLRIFSTNYQKHIEIKNPNITYHGNDLDLLKAAIKRTRFFAKVTLTTHHEMVPHSHLGTSSSISVAALAAIMRYQKKAINPIALAKLATALEVEELKLANGPQDQYAAALGGINMLYFNGRSVRVERVKVKQEILFELEKNLFLCYLGSHKVSGDLNQEVLDNYSAGHPKTVGAIRGIKQVTFDMHKQLKKGDLKDFASLLSQECAFREQLHRDIVNPLCKKFIQIGMRNGATGAKILGSGGGGTLLFYINDSKREQIARALENAGARTFDFRFDTLGVRTWEREI